MKLLLVFGICLILAIQISHQLPLGTKDLLRPRFPNRDHDQKAIFNDVQNKRLGKYWKTHGIRSVGESDVVAKEEAENVAPLVGVPSDFDHLEVGVITDNVNTEIKPESEKEIQVVKRGWFQKIWDTIKKAVVGSLFGMITKRSTDLDEQQFNTKDFELMDSEDVENIVLPDDIVEVHLGNNKNFEDKAEEEKEIQIVKRGWFKKIRRKIKNVLTGAVVGTVVGSVVKRESDDETKPVKAGENTLPLLLKTLRLRPGTANEITEIVEKLGKNSKFQDAMVDEIFESEKNDDEIVVERNGRAFKCRFVRGKYICF